MPRLSTLPEATAPAALAGHDRRLENLELAGAHAPVHAIVRRAAAQTIVNNTITAISFDTQVVDTAEMFATPPSTFITCKVPGLYLCTGHIVWPTATAAATRIITWLRLNGAATVAPDERTASTTEGPSQNVSAVLPLAINDTVELIVYHLNGAAQSRIIAGGTYSPRLSVVRLGPAA